MRRRVLVGIVVAAVVVVGAGALALQQAGTGTAPGQSESTSAGTDTPAKPGGSPAPPPTAVPVPEGVSEAGQGSGAENPEAPGESAESAPRQPLVTLPLPDPASADGAIVAGFPEQVLPAAPDSSIASSSVATEGTQLQATLSAETPLTVTEVVEFYRTALAAHGMAGTPAPAADGSTAFDFTRDSNSVTVTATATDRGSSYAVFATFTAES
jgi:hypothetical protein